MYATDLITEQFGQSLWNICWICDCLLRLCVWLTKQEGRAKDGRGKTYGCEIKDSNIVNRKWNQVENATDRKISVTLQIVI